jgi:hypothetical protein
MIRIFRTNRPIVFFYLLLVTFLFKGAFLLYPEVAAQGNNSFLAPYILSFLERHHAALWGLELADILIVFVTALLLNFLLSAYSIIERSSFVPALIYIILTSSFGAWVTVHPETLASLFVLMSLYNLYMLSGKEIGREHIFYTSLYLSIGSLFISRLSCSCRSLCLRS